MKYKLLCERTEKPRIFILVLQCGKTNDEGWKSSWRQKEDKLGGVYWNIPEDLREHTVEGYYPNSLSFLMNNYPLGCCQILQASPDVTVISLESPRNTHLCRDKHKSVLWFKNYNIKISNYLLKEVKSVYFFKMRINHLNHNFEKFTGG